MKVNNNVILQEDCSPQNCWRLARGTEVYPRYNGRVRMMKLLISDLNLEVHLPWLSKSVYLVRSVQKTVLLLEAE